MIKMSLSNIYFAFNKYLKKYAIFILIFLFCLSVRIMAVCQKDGLYIDEVFTFICTTPSNISPEGVILKNSHNSYNFEYGKNYNAREIKKSLFSSGSSPKSIIKDLQLIKNNNLDRSHTNFYYSLYRIASTGSSGLNYQQLLMRGCILNLLIFILEFFFMYKLLSLINNDKRFKVYGLLISLLSISSISNTLFIRDYILMECFLIGFSYVFLDLLLKNAHLNFKKLFGYSFITAAFILSGYLSLIYIGIILSILLFYSLFKKKYNIIKNILYIMIIAIGIVCLIYPTFFNFSYKNEIYPEIMDNLNSILTLRLSIIPVMKTILSFLLKSVFYWPCIAFIVLFYVFEYLYSNIFNKQFKQDKKIFLNDKLVILLVAISVLFIFISITIAHYKFERYIMPAVPILSLLLVLFVINLKSKLLRYFLIAIYILIPCINLYKENTDFDYMSTQSTYTFDKNDKYIFHVGGAFWYYPNYYILLPNDTIIRIEKNIPSSDYDIKAYKLITDINIPQYTDKEYLGYCFHIYTINNCFTGHKK